MRIFDVIKIDMKKICQFIVNNKQSFLWLNNVHKIKDISLGETNFCNTKYINKKI